jgi:tuberculosinol/isotuberculosinol synthase
MMIDFESFQKLAAAEVAARVRAAGPKVAVFPINGTRRWFALEHPEAAAGQSAEAYLRITWGRQVELYRLFFDHGVDTLLTPIFGPDLLERGEEYRSLVEPGLLWFTQDEEMLAFYEEYDVRVRVYGDTRRWLENSPYAATLEAFEAIQQRTADHQRHRLFFGVCAQDPTETVAEIGACYYGENGRLPNRREIVEAYYGEYVSPASFFIGFERPVVFDMPLLSVGEEDLYFTVSPSPYLDEAGLRAILYDHLYARPVSETYRDLTAEEWETLARFYRLNQQHILGLGRRHRSGSYWYPLPQVELLPELLAEEEDG